MIELTPMTASEFIAYMKIAVPNFANEKMRAEGLTRKEADKVAKDSFGTLLPKGVKSPGQHLFTVREKGAGKKLGFLWFARKKSGKGDYAYLYEIYLAKSARGKGVGTQAMALLEAEARKLRLRAIGLHVFGHNTVAQGLYAKIGYRPTNIVMTKDL